MYVRTGVMEVTSGITGWSCGWLVRDGVLPRLLWVWFKRVHCMSG